jgi:hypothetical protein
MLMVSVDFWGIPIISRDLIGTSFITRLPLLPMRKPCSQRKCWAMVYWMKSWTLAHFVWSRAS